MNGKAVNIRLLDPPLHEFLPHDELGIKTLSDTLNIPNDLINSKIYALREQNPMLGHRGC
ncbi:hypothetical protein EON78_07200, partial [bacterium]